MQRFQVRWRDWCVFVEADDPADAAEVAMLTFDGAGYSDLMWPLDVHVVVDGEEKTFRVERRHCYFASAR